MPGTASGRPRPGVGDYVEAYESALARDGDTGAGVEVGTFTPPHDHPDRLAILCELVRVDLEHQWDRARPRRLEHYRGLFPTLFADPALVREMAFEEYRLRLQAGERPTPDDYRQRFGLEGGEWPSSPPGQALAVEAPPPDRASGMLRAASAYREYRKNGSAAPAELDVLLDTHQVSREHAEFLRALDRTDPHAAERLAEGVSGLPKVGGTFLGFRLCGELGRGAFGRVYLARQGDLADRLVALKVSADVSGEARVLAQLHHTNVVPIYSVHRRGPLQAVCMPYLGATTLADTLSLLKCQGALPKSGEGLLSTLHAGKGRLPPSSGAGSSGGRARPSSDPATPAPATPAPEPTSTPTPEPAAPATSPQIERLRGLGYVPAVLWLVSRVADGLAHAHDRGILHRDLKPANILFADDGEPLLLDFNLAEDTKTHLSASVALVGGTLPYMAPEHLDAFRDGGRTVDARSDVYSLGVIFYELLTGTHPFPIRRGDVDAILPAMIADRLGPLPDVIAANPAVSPAVASIVRLCLAADPDRRYPSARALQDDLQRQLDHLPLKHAPEPSVRERLGKWAWRHPRLTSSTTVGLVAASLIAALSVALVSRRQEFRKAEAAASLERLAVERRDAVALLVDPDAAPEQLAEGLGICDGAASRYHALDDPSWLGGPLASLLPKAGIAKLRESLGELLVLSARAQARRAGVRDGQARRAGLSEAAKRLEVAEACFGRGAEPRTFFLARADLARASGRGDDEVRKLLDRAGSIPLRTTREQLLSSADRVEPDDRRRLLAVLDAVEDHDLSDLDYAKWMMLGNWNAKLGRKDDAAHCYGVAVALAPGVVWPRVNRGLLYLELRDHSQALGDFDRVVALRPEWASAYLNRALAKLGLDDAGGAVDDLTRCLALKRAPTRAWFIRGRAKARLGDLAGARLDREEGLKRPPGDPASFVSRGLARLPADPKAALADFESALALDPRYLPALQDKASVLSENLGRAEEAVAVLDRAIEHHPTAVDALAGRGVLLARLGRREAAVRDARASLALDDKPLTAYQAACVFALTSRVEPKDRPEAFRLLSRSVKDDASWLRVAPTDPDLAPVRDLPEFRDLLRAMTVIHKGARL